MTQNNKNDKSPINKTKMKKIPILINIVTNDENHGGNTININLPLN